MFNLHQTSWLEEIKGFCECSLVPIPNGPGDIKDFLVVLIWGFDHLEGLEAAPGDKEERVVVPVVLQLVPEPFLCASWIHHPLYRLASNPGFPYRRVLGTRLLYVYELQLHCILWSVSSINESGMWPDKNICPLNIFTSESRLSSANHLGSCME